MAMTTATMRFFQTAASRDILPGEKSSPFSSRRVSPTECDELRGRTAERPDARQYFGRRVYDERVTPQRGTQ